MLLTDADIEVKNLRTRFALTMRVAMQCLAVEKALFLFFFPQKPFSPRPGMALKNSQVTW